MIHNYIILLDENSSNNITENTVLSSITSVEWMTEYLNKQQELHQRELELRIKQEDNKRKQMEMQIANQNLMMEQQNQWNNVLRKLLSKLGYDDVM